MKFLKLLFFSTLLLFSTRGFSRVNLDIGLIYKNGISKGLVLTSELHKSHHLIAGEEIVLEMRSGVEVKLFSIFEVSNVGPLNQLFVTGELFKKGELLLKIRESLTVGESKKIHFENSQEMIEVILTPIIL